MLVWTPFLLERFLKPRKQVLTEPESLNPKPQTRNPKHTKT